jgi:UDPglucose 6-dehydrogenase
LVLIDQLLAGGASVRVHDPEAMENVRAMYGDRLVYALTPLEAISGADCLVIVTEWGDYRRPDFDEMVRLLKSPVIFDGRNLYSDQEMHARGFQYYPIGKPPIHAVENGTVEKS